MSKVITNLLKDCFCFRFCWLCAIDDDNKTNLYKTCNQGMCSHVCWLCYISGNIYKHNKNYKFKFFLEFHNLKLFKIYIKII